MSYEVSLFRKSAMFLMADTYVQDRLFLKLKTQMLKEGGGGY